VKPLVIEASAALKLVRPEAGREEVRRLMRERRAAGAHLLVPAIFWLELVNTLARRHRYPAAAILEATYALERVGLETAEIGRAGVLAVIDLVHRFGLTAYDAAYVALATASDAELLTADRMVAQAAGERARYVGPAGSLAEAAAIYRTDPSWAAWPGAAAYLQQLRATLVEEAASHR
jgi:predicted nucleic acid-binding protein